MRSSLRTCVARLLRPLSILIVVVVAGAPPSAARASSPFVSRVLQAGEELTYNVRYGFIDLGQVRIRVLHKLEGPTYRAYAGKALIDSYPKLPFVDLHAVFESFIDSAVYSRAFSGKIRDGDTWEFARYTFQYDNNRVVTEVGYRDTVIQKRDTLFLGSVYQDGLSLFFYARDQLYSGRKILVPTIIKEKKVTTYLNFRQERTSVEIDAIDYPVDVVAFDGTANFVGLFGLTGDFEGWFSNDEARIPILAKMKVIIGSVTIELMSWKRSGWTPPRAEE